MQPGSRLVCSLAVVAVVALTGCGDDSTAAPVPAAPLGPTTTTTATTAAPFTIASTTAAPRPAPTTAAPSAPPTTAPPVISVRIGVDDFQTTGGRVETVARGVFVTLRITGPKADAYHLHGYDIEQKAAANQTAEISFTADKTGTFDVETHSNHKTILRIAVT